MNDGNSYNNYTSSSDKCPKCGAVKMFSALVCPSCGTRYDDMAPKRNAPGTGYVTNSASSFDPNASFAAYKRSLEPQAEAASGDANTASASQEGSQVLSGIAELDKPVELDPIAKKLQEMANQNNAASSAGPTSGNGYQGQQFQGRPNQGQPYQGTPYQGQPYQSQPYQGQPYQGTPNQGTPYGGVPNQASQYQGRPDQGASYQGGQYQGSPYNSPYSRPTFTTVPDTGSGKGGKIFAAVIALILIALVGYGAYRYSNCDKNEKGVSYDAGKAEFGTYTNEWAEVKIDVSGEVRNYSYMAGDSSFKSTVDGLKSSVKAKDVDVEVNFIGAVETKVGSVTYPIPSIVMITISNNSLKTKVFGAKIEDFFDDTDMSRVALPAGYSFVNESDMLICGHSYKTYCVTMPYDQNTSMKMYMCVRTIGNKMVLFYFYDIPGFIDIDTIKRSFIN